MVPAYAIPGRNRPGVGLGWGADRFAFWRLGTGALGPRLVLPASGLLTGRWHEKHLGWATASTLARLLAAPIVASIATESPLPLMGLLPALVVAGALASPWIMGLCLIVTQAATVMVAGPGRRNSWFDLGHP